MANNPSKPSAGPTPVEALFDHAIDVTGMPKREDDEFVGDYIARKTFGPNTRENLLRALEAAQVHDRVQVISSMSSARDHFDDPNPPDTKPRKP